LVWLEKKTDKGVLKYRMPNIIEGYEFLSMVETIKNGADLFRVKGKFISKMSPLIDYSSCGYSSWEDLINDKQVMFHPLSDIAQELFDDVTAVLVKKI
jgi:hypothetical protein